MAKYIADFKLIILYIRYSSINIRDIMLMTCIYELFINSYIK